MNILLSYRKHLSFILCMSLIISIFGFMPGQAYGETTAVSKEAVSLESKITEPEKGDDYDGFIVRIKDSRVNRVKNNDEAEDVPSSPSDRFYLVKTTLEALEFASASSISYVEPNNRVYTTSDVPDDPDYKGEESGTKKQRDMYEAMGIHKLWDEGLDGEGVTVAVLDSGINAHQDMDSEDIDVYYSGFTEDDEYIYEDFTKSAIGNDSVGHGTQVTSLIKAKKNNTKNIAGIAPESDIIFIKVFQENAQGQTYGYSAQIVWGLDYLLAENVPDVVNMSLATKVSTSFDTVCTDLANAGCIVVASSGNYGNKTDSDVSPNINDIVHPAGLPNVIGVGAVDSSSTITNFSTKNSSVDVSAWGSSVPVLSDTNNTATRTNNGTSFSSPIVAGIAACLKQSNPKMNHNEFLDVINTTSTKKGDVSVGNRNDSYGYGIISAGGIYKQLNPYTVTFNIGDGQWTSPNKLNNYGTDYTPIPLPTNVALTGHSFGGWYDNASYSGINITQIPSGSATDLTYYAKWNVNPYTINLDSNGGSTLSPSSLTYYYDSKLTGLPTPTRTGYSFDGWHIDSENGTPVGDNTTVKGDMNLVAKWNPKPCTITFELNGGGTVSPSSLIYNYDSKMTNLPIPTWTGYKFEGWYSNPECLNLIDDSTTVKGNQTIYAKWGTKINIIFDPGTGVTPPDSKHITVGDPIGTLPAISKTGYTFEGWYLDSSYKDEALPTTIAEATDMTLYAKWTPNTYTITLNSNGGTPVANSTLKFQYDSKLTGLPTPVRTGYGFLGWYTAPSGGTQVGPATAVKGNMTLYARWAQNTYKISFNVNKGKKMKTTSKNVKYGQQIGSLPTPKRSKYNFLGWKTKKSGGTTYLPTTKYNSTKNLTLYANWTKKKVVKFNANGGVVTTYSKAFTKGKKYGSLPKATKAGYKFKGWYTKKKGGKKITAKTKVKTKKNHTVYAQWKK